jgi:hypothetical protein
MVFLSDSELVALFVQYRQQKDKHKDCIGVHLHRELGLFTLFGGGRLIFEWVMPKPKAEKKKKK